MRAVGWVAGAFDGGVQRIDGMDYRRFKKREAVPTNR